MISSEKSGSLRVVRFDRAPVNALDVESVRGLHDALREAEADEAARALVLAGRENAFCVGLDNQVLAAGGDASTALLSEMGELLVALYASPLPIVVACSGHAVAAGAMLLLVSDLRVGAEGSYRVGFSEVANGLPLPRLPSLLARERLDRRFHARATLLGELWSPAQAAEIGFLDRLVPSDALLEAAREDASRLAALPPGAYADSVEPVRGQTLEALRASMRR